MFDVLMDMLSYKRPAGSRSEKAFIRRFIDPHKPEIDRAGNRILRIGTAPVLWSAHTDTVHTSGGRQDVHIDSDGVISLRNQKTSRCLGADDGAGVWLLCEMIRRDVEGLYIFHRGEEIGGIGSSHIADKTPYILEGIDYAIAFDRRGRTSVITRQAGGMCASDAFAEALGKELGMAPDEGGTFTDTANYTDLVPECTNVSVGYQFAHGPKEELDSPFIISLLPKLAELDVSKLPIERRPGDNGPDVFDWDWGSGGFYGGKESSSIGLEEEELDAVGDDYFSLVRLCEEEPDLVADVLSDYGITAREILKNRS